ncbi:MAG: hypothetical protein ABL931_01725 [Usitatibacteraceae bacterium]
MTTNGIHDFAFQTGEWRVRHKKLKQRLAGSDEWFAFDGTCRAWEILGGKGNVEDQWLDDPTGAYAAAAVRQMDPKTGIWSIWWIDPRFPGIDPPVHGRFEDGVGTFRGEDVFNGKPIHVRFVWSKITADSAHWEQAFSADGGKSWETNWVMTFDRTG